MYLVKMKTGSLLFTFFFMMTTISAQIKNSKGFEKIIRREASPLLLDILNQPATYRYQLIYTQIDRDSRNTPRFKNYYLNVDPERYFNPASMVKLPVALAALEKLHTLPVQISPGTTMLTDSSRKGQTAVATDKKAANGLPSIGHYVKKIFLISDNDAYNRLYEFVGQKPLNETLWQKGYKNQRITRRFVPMNPEENRYTNRIRFVDGNQTLYVQPAAYSDLKFDFSKKILMGTGHWDKDDKLIPEPMDFTEHNNSPLEDLQKMLQSVLFPQSVPEGQRFRIGQDDYNLLYHYMSEKPSESRFPLYDTTEYFDSYTKFFFFKDGKQKIPDYIRSFNKTGWSYGFLTDVCYIVDFKNKVEFMLSGNIYVNSDGILNDNKYEYEELGYPFFREIGEIVYKHELQRKRKYRPDLGGWQFVYD